MATFQSTQREFSKANPSYLQAAWLRHGTLKNQDDEIKKLSSKLAQKQFQDGETSKMLLDQQQARDQKSARDLKTFLNSSRIAD